MAHRSQVLVSFIVGGFLLTAGIATAQRGGPADGAPGRHWGTERTSAICSLTPVGAAEGWGRIMVMDLATADSVERMATVHLYGLEPESAYTVFVDPVTELATVVTDLSGDGWVRLGSRGYASDPVPETLPLASDLVSAQVLNASLAPTLEGDFQILVNGGFSFGGLVHMERIELLSDDPAVTRGIARVARDHDDAQYFESRACGLTPGAVYEISANGFPAGIVTADAVGHASIFLATDGVADPLPIDLQPIENLRPIKWTTATSTAVNPGEDVLWGDFTGENMIGGGDGGGNGGNGGGNGGDNGGGNGGDNGGGNGGDNGGGNGGDNGGGNGGDNGGGNDNGNGNGNGGGNSP